MGEDKTDGLLYSVEVEYLPCTRHWSVLGTHQWSHRRPWFQGTCILVGTDKKLSSFGVGNVVMGIWMACGGSVQGRVPRHLGGDEVHRSLSEGMTCEQGAKNEEEWARWGACKVERSRAAGEHFCENAFVVLEKDDFWSPEILQQGFQDCHRGQGVLKQMNQSFGRAGMWVSAPSDSCREWEERRELRCVWLSCLDSLRWWLFIFFQISCNRLLNSDSLQTPAF